MNPPIPPCPSCKGKKAKLAFSRDVYPEHDEDHCGPPEAVAHTYECQCGNVYIVKVAPNRGRA